MSNPSNIIRFEEETFSITKIDGRAGGLNNPIQLDQNNKTIQPFSSSDSILLAPQTTHNLTEIRTDANGNIEADIVFLKPKYNSEPTYEYEHNTTKPARIHLVGNSAYFYDSNNNQVQQLPISFNSILQKLREQLKVDTIQQHSSNNAEIMAVSNFLIGQMQQGKKIKALGNNIFSIESVKVFI